MAPPYQVLLDDPVRGSTVAIAVPQDTIPIVTLGDFFKFYRSTDRAPFSSKDRLSENAILERRRFADSLFHVRDGGTLGDLDPDLRFLVDGQPQGLERKLADLRSGDGMIRIAIDRRRAGYPRNWPAYLERRWNFRATEYQRFVEAVVEGAYGGETESILQLDTPDRIRRFLTALTRCIHAAPYETYSRYLAPYPRFKSCDQVLDSILEGDGGICAEKAMALYFIARIYGLPAEVVLGGEDAAGSFPYHALRSILDQPSFDFTGTEECQRYWQHFAVLCGFEETEEDFAFCDVAGSNIPPIVWDARTAFAYLNPSRRQPLRVKITHETLNLYYHRIARRQDIPLDLYYAMEHYLDSIDLIQTIDNELGLLHTGDFWIGVIAHASQRERNEIVREYQRFVSQADLDPRQDLLIARNLFSEPHPLVARFLDSYPRQARKLAATDPHLQRRIDAIEPGPRYTFEYVIMTL